jgi:RimJ/RimL family protein N-acetyltransferase
MLPLETERLLLRALRAGDARIIHGYRNDPEVARYQDWTLPFSLAMAEQLVYEQALIEGPIRGDWIQLGVEHQGELVGDMAVGLDRAGTVATIGYTLRTDRQGRGFATEAAGALIDALFARGVGRVVATIDPLNVRSARLLERLGFHYERRAIGAALVRGTWVDDDLYAVSSDERATRVAHGIRPAT